MLQVDNLNTAPSIARVASPVGVRVWVTPRRPIPPLFEKERHAGGRALIAQQPRPVGVHRPRAVLAALGVMLAAGDNPIELADVPGELSPMRPPLQLDALDPQPRAQVDRPEHRLAAQTHPLN